MKRFQAKYTENSITYWPTYEVGKIGIIFFVILGSLFVALALWVLLDNSSKKTFLQFLIALPLAVVALYVVISFMFRIMHAKIVVSTEGILYFKYDGLIEKQISWENVSAVYFSKDIWHGTKSCRIFLDGEKHNEKDICDFVLPVYAVDEKKLLQLIPAHLWKNKPWYS